jgi:Zn-dependent M28 family amino/carboxypeptidase
VKATTAPGEYKQVSAAILGTDPSLPEVWVNAHDNHRNTGVANNLTGVGATIEVARVLRKLIAAGVRPRPARTIRFMWGAEHMASTYGIYAHPERRERFLAMLNVDMVGYHQERAKAVMNLYRTPYSRPHFLSDVAEELMRSMGRANTISLRNRREVSQLAKLGPFLFHLTSRHNIRRIKATFALESAERLLSRAGRSD